MQVLLRSVEPCDHRAIRRLAARRVGGVPPWRPAAAVERAVHGWAESSMAAADPVSRPVLVAVDEDGVVVGFVSGGTRVHWSGETDAYVGELVVGTTPRGPGSGTG